MSWIDMHMQQQRAVSAPVVSPDGSLIVYAISDPDWKRGSRQSDIYLASVHQGVKSTRRLTSTPAKNESQPRWTPDGQRIFFVSNRDAKAAGSAANQLYVMSTDGGDVRKVTEIATGVPSFDLTPDGRWVVIRAAAAGTQQLYAFSATELASGTQAAPQQLTKHPTGVRQWQFTPDAKHLYYLAPEAADPAERARQAKGFTVEVRDAGAPVTSLWVLDLAGGAPTRVAGDPTQSIENFHMSPDGRWIAYRGIPNDRYKRRPLVESPMYADLYLLATISGRVERLTNNAENMEVAPTFSPDSQWIGYSSGPDTGSFNHRNKRLYLRRVDETGGKWRVLGQAFDGDVQSDFWSADGRTIYFDAGIRATTQMHALDVATGAVTQLTNVKGTLSVTQHPGGRLIAEYSDPVTPPVHVALPGMDRIADRETWTQLSDPYPEVRALALGDMDEITWKSSDGASVGGILVKPVGYEQGKRYPLIVILHGGPHDYEALNFNAGGDGAQVYAGAGYVVLIPNYRGSTNYGEKFKTAINGAYNDLQFADVMSGVDHVIAQGLADPARMGVLGHSAGGTLGAWLLTHTTRFKAISAGAAVVNWISMYATSDFQRPRRLWFNNKLPYQDFDSWWNQSALKYINRAKTPTFVYATKGDPRVPSSQALELYTALQNLGVPTELFMYPGNAHGIPPLRNRALHSMVEMAWMDYYVRGTGSKFSWEDVLKTLESGS